MRALWQVVQSVVVICVYGLITRIFAKLGYKLGENAVISWMDDRIGEVRSTLVSGLR